MDSRLGGTMDSGPFGDSTSFLAGGGEMGALMRAKDWSQSPLGPPGAWPQSLKTVVRIMLTSRYAMWMAWGAELTLLLQRRLPAHPRRQAPLGARGAGPARSGRRSGRTSGRASRRCWTAARRPGTKALLLVPGAQRLSRGDLPHVLLQPARRRRRHDRRHALRGHRGDRAGHRRAAIGDVCASSPRSWPERHRREEVFAAVDRSLGANPRDLPFTLTYLFDARRHRRRSPARPASRADHPAAPAAIDTRPTRIALAGGRDPDGERVADHRRRLSAALRQPARRRLGQSRRAQAVIVADRPARPGQAGGLPGRRPQSVSPRSTTPIAGFIDLIAGQIAVRPRQRRRLRGGAPARRGAGGARPGQDGLLLQCQPRVPHAAHPDAGPARGAAGASRTADCGRQPASSWRWPTATRSGCSSSSTRCSTSRASRPGASRRAIEPTDLAAFTAELASNFRSAMDRAGLRFVDRLPAARRSRSTSIATCGKRSSSICSRTRSSSPSSGEIGDRARSGTDGGRSSSRCAIPASAFRRHELPIACSSASIASRASAAAPSRAPASGWRWCRSWSSCTAAPSGWRASSTRGTAFTVRIPFGTAHLPPDGNRREPRSGEPDACRRPMSRRRCAGCRTTAAEPSSPICPDDIEPASSRGGPARAATGAFCSPTTTPTCATMCGRLLAERGYQVEAVSDGEAALAAARARRARPGPVRRHDAAARRLRSAARLARRSGAARHPGDPAVGPCRRGSPGRGPRRRRRRLPDQAVLGPRAARARRHQSRHRARAQRRSSTRWRGSTPSSRSGSRSAPPSSRPPTGSCSSRSRSASGSRRRCGRCSGSKPSGSSPRGWRTISTIS